MRFIELDDQDYLNREGEFARIAADCDTFLPDDEEEWVVESAVNCMNCRRRRWVAGGFQCMKEES